MKRLVSDHDLIAAFQNVKARKGRYMVGGDDIAKELKTKLGIDMHESTVRGRFIKMGKPIGKQRQWVQTNTVVKNKFTGATNKMAKTTKFKDGASVWVVKDVEKLSTDKQFAAPGITPEVIAMAGKRFTVDFTDNHGFIHLKENGNVMLNEGWLTDKPDVVPVITRPLPASQAAGYQYPAELQTLIPKADEFKDYVERPVDTVLSMHYALNKFPITQGPQGTGKTRGHAYYAMTEKRPFLLLSCFEDFKLPKIFGDKTIQNGSITFQESLFTRAIQHPCVILFDEINAVSQANTFDFHALLQNRCLFIKDADNGNGKQYVLHPDCKIGFSQNPKSAKYIGGQVRASNFLGRCTYITYGGFDKKQLHKAVALRYPDLPKDEAELFIKYFNAVVESLERAQINVDISIRQLFNAIDFNIHGMDLEQALEGGITSITEAVSNPKAKEALNELSRAIWKERFEAGKAGK